MKVISLSKDDALVLQAAHSACQDAEAALDKAHKKLKSVKSDYSKLLNQLSEKHKLQEGAPSDDHCYLYGCPLPEIEVQPIALDAQG